MPHRLVSEVWIRWSGGPAALPLSLPALLLRRSENLRVTSGGAAPRRNILSEESVKSNMFSFSPLVAGSFHVGGADHFHSLCLHSESGGSAPQLFRHTPHTGCDVDVSALRWDEADSRLYELEKEKKPFESMAAPVFCFFFPCCYS